MSTEKPTIYAALSQVMAAVQSVGKDKRNPEHGYMFRGIDAVVNAVGPKLREHGVLAIPQLLDVSYRDVQTSRGKPSRECTVKVRYTFYGPAGDSIDTIVPGESMDYGDKGTAKAMSVAYRIALLQALCIPTDEPDADSHTYERAHDDRPQVDREQVRQNILANARAAIGASPVGGLRAIQDRIGEYVKNGAITVDDQTELMAVIGGRQSELESNRAASLPAEDRTAEPADQPEGWPETAQPGASS